MRLIEIAFVAGSGLTGTTLFLAAWRLFGSARPANEHGEAENVREAKGEGPQDADKDASAGGPGNAGEAALDALTVRVAALEAQPSAQDDAAREDLAADLEACRREAASLGARLAALEAAGPSAAEAHARLTAEAEKAAGRLTALEALDPMAEIEGRLDAAIAAQAGRLGALEAADPATAKAAAEAWLAEAQARLDAALEAAAARMAASEAFDAAALVEAAVRAHKDAAPREIDPAAAEERGRLVAALEAQEAQLAALEKLGVSQAVLETSVGQIASGSEETAARLAAIEAADPLQAVQSEVRAGVERAMRPVMARVAALRDEVEAAVETRLTPLLSRLNALEEERMVLRRTVNLTAPNVVTGFQEEVGAIADGLSALASTDPQPAPCIAKPRVTMLSSTKI